VSSASLPERRPIIITRIRSLLLHDERPQYEVAALMGIHPSTLSQYGLGRKEVLPHHLVLMSRFWRLDAEHILGYVDEPDIVEWLDEDEKKPQVIPR
jgi:hypothetical protein